MNGKELVIREIQAAFINNEYPGDNYLQGSFEGSEPFEEIEPFKGQKDWMKIPSQVLDRHTGALNFFSEGGLRYYLPALSLEPSQSRQIWKPGCSEPNSMV